MEGDRAAVLTLRSAVKGVVDYSKVDLHSTAWWKRWRYLLKGMTEIEHGELLRMAYDLQLALVSNSKISPEDFSKVQKDAKNTFLDIESTYKPWLGRSKQDRETQDFEKFKESWKEIGGFDLDDKEALSSWEEEVEKISDEKLNEQVKFEQQKEEKEQSFERKVREIEQKRLSQQRKLR